MLKSSLNKSVKFSGVLSPDEELELLEELLDELELDELEEELDEELELELDVLVPGLLGDWEAPQATSKFALNSTSGSWRIL